jgi:hypothetical protein
MSTRYAGPLLVVVLLTSPGDSAPVPAAKPPAVQSEVHVVSIYEGAKDPAGGGVRLAGVVVDRPDVEVTLVLSAYDPVSWTVTATPKTKIKKVILAGYHRQGAAVPQNAPVVEMFHEGREGNPYLYFPHALDSSRFRPAVQALKDVTQQELRSFRSTYLFDPANPLTVDSVQDEPRLNSDYPKLTPAAEVAKIKFQATHLTPAGRFDVAGSFGDFTQAGPVRDSLKPLPKDIRRLTFDPKGKKYYGLTTHEVHEVDLEKRTSTKMDLGLLKLSSPRAITFDTKANRLLVVASRAIYEYDPATGKWNLLADLPRGLDLAGLTYHANNNTLYGLGKEFAGDDDSKRPTLYEFNAKGAIVKATELAPPMFPGLIDRGPDTRIQIVSAGAHLAVLVGGPAPRDGNGKPLKAESFLFLIDPASEKVTLGWKE